jgi:hypothetical protein
MTTTTEDVHVDVQILPSPDRTSRPDSAENTGSTGGPAGAAARPLGVGVGVAPGQSSDRVVDRSTYGPTHSPVDDSLGGVTRGASGTASGAGRGAGASVEGQVAGAGRPLMLGVTGLCVAVLAGVAGAVSFDHMRELAAAHGQHGWKAYAFPVSVDGLEVVAGLYLVAQRRAGRPTGWLPWAALALGSVASVAANVAVGGQDPLGKALAGWPALSLLVTLKLLFSMLEHTAPARPAPCGPAVVPDGPVIVPDGPDGPDDHRTVPSSSAVSGTAPGANAAGVRVVPSQRPMVGGAGQDAALGLGRPVGDAGAGPMQGNRARPVDAGAVTGLLPSARRARDVLACNGRALSRDALADAMRRDGQALSNARASLLLKILRAEDITHLHKAAVTNNAPP